MSDASVTPCRLLLDTNLPDEMTRFYTERLGFEHVETTGSPVMFQRRRLRQASTGVEIEFRDCKPRPHVGSLIGSMLELGLRVEDPERATEGLEIDARHPEEGPVERIVVRDPSNYTLVLERL